MEGFSVITDFYRKSSLLALHVCCSHTDYSGNVQSKRGTLELERKYNLSTFLGVFWQTSVTVTAMSIKWSFFCFLVSNTSYICGLFSGQQSFLCSNTIQRILLSKSYVVNICDFYGLCLDFKFQYHLLIDVLSYQILRSILCS